MDIELEQLRASVAAAEIALQKKHLRMQLAKINQQIEEYDKRSNARGTECATVEGVSDREIYK